MTFDPTIPQDLPPPTVIVDQIRTNFAQYATVFDNNHVALNDSQQGKHTNVILQEQLSNPIVSGNFDSLFGKSVTTTSSTSQELFVTIPQFLPVDKLNIPMQLTFNSVNTAGPQYQAFLAGGYIIYWGTVASANPTVNATITLSPVPSKIVCVIPNPTKLGGVGVTTAAIKVYSTLSTSNPAQFTINATFPGGTGDIKWLAIAKQ